MALTPYLLLTKPERVIAGLKRPVNGIWLLNGFLLGGLAAFVIFVIGHVMYGDGQNNWFVSVGRYYVTTPGMEGFSLFQQFLAFTVPALIFSPVGEEIFFRGVMQSVLAETWNYKISVVVNSVLFGVLHLFHHGIIAAQEGIQWLPVSGFIWSFLIMGTGVLFAFVRRKTDAVWGATVAHMAFNLCMNFTIFYIM